MKGFTTAEEQRTLQKQKEERKQMSILEKFPEYNFIAVMSDIGWKNVRIIPNDFSLFGGPLFHWEEYIKQSTAFSIFADYITKPDVYKIAIFVKDRKWGLMQINRGISSFFASIKILIAMYYKLKWYRKGQFLYAYTNEDEKPFLIDINNNRLK